MGIALVPVKRLEQSKSRLLSHLPDPRRQTLTLAMLADLLEARRVLLLARGAAKAQAVARALTAAPDEALPASALQRHPALTVLLDEQAASLMPR